MLDQTKTQRFFAKVRAFAYANPIKYGFVTAAIGFALGALIF